MVYDKLIQPLVLAFCLWSDQPELMAFLWVFNGINSMALFFESCGLFYIFHITLFLLQPVDLICYQAHILIS